MPVNVGSIVASSLKAAMDGVADQIYVNTRTLKVLYGKSGFRKEQRGGEKITMPVEYRQNTNFQWMNSTTQYTIGAQDPFDEAEFQWRMCGVTIPILEEYEVKNRGEYAIFDLVEKLKETCVKTMREEMNAMVFNDGTDPLAPVGLQAIVSTSGTYGAIARSGNTWWQGCVDSTAEVFSITDMDTQYRIAQANTSSAPDCFVTTGDLLDKYEDDARQFLNINALRTADLGFESTRYKGMPFWWDEDCPSGNVFGVNSTKIKLVCDPDREYKVGEKIILQQPAYVLPFRWWGNLVAQPRFHFRLSGKTVS